MSTLTRTLHAVIDALPIDEEDRVTLRRLITEYGCSQSLAGMEFARRIDRRD